VGSEENRVVRPPRQACHRKGSGANRFNRHNRYDRLRAGDMEKEPPRAGREQATEGLPWGFVQHRLCRWLLIFSELGMVSPELPGTP